MELEDAILSALAEIEDEKKSENVIDIINQNNSINLKDTISELKNIAGEDEKENVRYNIPTTIPSFKSPFSEEKTVEEKPQNSLEKSKNDIIEKIEEKNNNQQHKELVSDNNQINDEKLFLKNLRERLLVLFEGFQSPNNKNKISSKIDLMVNFLEYLLALTDERLDKINRK